MPDRLRLGLVGVGPVVERYHLRAVRGVPEVQPVAVVDINEERVCQFALQQGFPLATTRLQDLFGKVDLAIVALPNGLHASVACELLSSGIHVLCEKPMARNVPECQAMIEAAQDGGVLLCIGHNRRFRNNVTLAKRLIEKGILGEVTRIEAEEGSPADWPRSPAYFDPTQAGGGALIDVGIHSIDLIRWLVGEFGKIEYRGNGTATTVESEAELRFRMTNGAQGKLLASRTWDLQQHIRITGSEGYLDIGLWSDNLRMRSNKGKAFQQLPHLDAYVSRRPPQDPSFVLQLNNFVNAIRGKEKVLVDGFEGMAAVEVVTRAYDHSAPLDALPAELAGGAG
jgi:UDP-N-acetylglucosamine 3-dehydrogenase